MWPVLTSRFEIRHLKRIHSLSFIQQIYDFTWRHGNPHDNAKAESFMKTLKVEAVYPMAFETFQEVAEHFPHFIEEVSQQTQYSIRQSLI